MGGLDFVAAQDFPLPTRRAIRHPQWTILRRPAVFHGIASIVQYKNGILFEEGF